jgi:hypothetical protein
VNGRGDGSGLWDGRLKAWEVVWTEGSGVGEGSSGSVGRRGGCCVRPCQPTSPPRRPRLRSRRRRTRGRAGVGRAAVCGAAPPLDGAVSTARWALLIQIGTGTYPSAHTCIPQNGGANPTSTGAPEFRPERPSVRKAPECSNHAIATVAQGTSECQRDFALMGIQHSGGNGARVSVIVQGGSR